jgi:hypothetical protein
MSGAITEVMNIKKLKDFKRQTAIMDKDPNLMLVSIYSSKRQKENMYENTLTTEIKVVRYRM